MAGHRHALVTGASQGIGRASALALAARGIEVTVLARRAAKLEELIPELEHAGAPRARSLPMDLGRRDDLLDGLARLLAEHGPVHVLVNNTGGPPPGPLLAAEPADLVAAFNGHVVAAHTLTRALLPGMEREGYGRIINVISLSVREPIPNLGVSNTIRGAMASWAKTLSMELPPGITVNNVLPGYTDTTRLRALMESVADGRGVSPEEIEREWVASVPEGRLGRPEELGAVVAFLASPEASYIRGTSIPVDGGRLRCI